MVNVQNRIWPSGLAMNATDAGAQTFSTAINGALVKGTSGTAWFGVISAAVGMSSATLTLYVYVGSVTGSPTFQLQIWGGATGAEDDDRPTTSGSNLASAPSTLTLTSADNNTWVSLTATVSLTASETYFLVIENTHATPASNHSTFAVRGALDSINGGLLLPFVRAQRAGYTTDGWAASDGVLGNGTGPFITRYGDGTIIGFPYVGSETAASSSNDRGMRVQFNENVAPTNLGFVHVDGDTLNVEINAASDGANLASHTLDLFQRINSPIAYLPMVTMLGGAEYDCVMTFGAAATGTLYHMGESLANVPADVLACRPLSWGYVNGATPGSYVLDNSRLWPFALGLDDNPAITGGGGTTLVLPQVRKVR